MIILISSFFVLLPILATFASDSPVSIQPPLSRPPTKLCEIVLIDISELSYWSEVVEQSFHLPEKCLPPWSKVILDVFATESGTQFDRYGALWLGGIELLRTTTPEPTATGINWHIEKDVSLYGSHFVSPNLTAYLAIPNNVDDTYTGVIEINATLSFFAVDSEGSYPPQSLPFVFPLTNAPQNSNPFSVMQINADQSLSYSFNLPSEIFSVENVYLDVFASAHGCEEFYYSNLPNYAASDYGFCGGGIYREIQVYLDGQLAAITTPFPVIYTGGINPLLWRPITGMMSFDIPSHRFDVTPFSGIFLDRQTHNISITVLGNNVDGYWLLDAALLISSSDSPYHFKGNTQKAFDIIGGEELTIKDSGTALVEEKKVIAKERKLIFSTVGSHILSVSSSLRYRDGSVRLYSLDMELKTNNNNTLIGETTSVTVQQNDLYMKSQLYSEGGYFTTETISKFPLYVEDYYLQDENTFDMQATVLYGLDSVKQWQFIPDISIRSSSETAETGVAAFTYSLAWSNSMESNATYNRSLDHSSVYNYNDTARDSFRIFSEIQSIDETTSKTSFRGLSDQPPCFRVTADSLDGMFIFNHSKTNHCMYPAGISFCGYEICGSLTATGVQELFTKRSGENIQKDGDIISTSIIPKLNFDDVELTHRRRHRKVPT